MRANICPVLSAVSTVARVIWPIITKIRPPIMPAREGSIPIRAKPLSALFFMEMKKIRPLRVTATQPTKDTIWHRIRAVPYVVEYSVEFLFVSIDRIAPFLAPQNAQGSTLSSFFLPHISHFHIYLPPHKFIGFLIKNAFLFCFRLIPIRFQVETNDYRFIEY
jgi:hypothetical protein